MRPALSVILFTVLSGAGLGALALVALADLASQALARTLAPGSMTTVSVIALALVIAGLGASTLHLAKPSNAWRSLARWRSSWLSREALAAFAFMPIAVAYVALRALDAGAWTAVLAIAVVLLAWVMLHCTAMIYASLKPIRQWHTPRVPLAFWLLAHASGALLVMSALSSRPVVATESIVVSLVLFVLALGVKLEYWWFVGRSRGGVTLESALGVPHGVGPPHRGRGDARTVAARVLDVGHSKGTFLTHEFLHVSAAATRRILRVIALVAGFGIPLLWLAAGLADWRAGAVTFVICMIGLIAERWLFFAEARHTVRLYHGDAAT